MAGSGRELIRLFFWVLRGGQMVTGGEGGGGKEAMWGGGVGGPWTRERSGEIIS
jgi:hypothetical protein